MVLTKTERLSQNGEDALGDELGTRSQGHALGQDHELIAAEAGHGVGVTKGGGEPGGHRLEELVAGGVAEGVVDPLEAVEVDEKQCDVEMAPAPPRHGLGHPVNDQSTVRQAGQVIVQGLVADLVDEPGVADGDGRLGGEATQALGDAGVVVESLGVGGDGDGDPPEHLAARGDTKRGDPQGAGCVHGGVKGHGGVFSRWPVQHRVVRRQRWQRDLERSQTRLGGRVESEGRLHPRRGAARVGERDDNVVAVDD